MKKHFSLVFVLPILFLVGCTNPLSSPTDSNTGNVTTGIIEEITGSDISITGQNIPERQTYENKTDNFLIQFPSTRTFQEKAFQSSVMFFTPLVGDDTIKENVGIMKKILDKEYTLEDYYTITKPQLINLIPGFTEISNQSIKVNDIDAQKLIYTGTQGTTQLKWEQVYLIKDKAVYIITYTATAATFNDFVQKIDEMVSTLEIK